MIPMSSLPKIRWSPHSDASQQQFLSINASQHELCLYQVTQSKGTEIKYELVARHSKIPHIRCFDWSPIEKDLVAVGQASGEALLLRINANTNSTCTLAVKQQRACNSVAFNTEGLLATGLDKVRHDYNLNIWDINERLATIDQSRAKPVKTLSPSEGIISLRFFPDQPSNLAAGVAQKGIRIFDLRDSASSPVLSAPSKCICGISIDKDPNYFASYSDDGIVSVWDRRNTRSTTGGEPVLAFTDEQGSKIAITSLLYSTQKSGTFAILNITGGLKVYETEKFTSPEPSIFLADPTAEKTAFKSRQPSNIDNRNGLGNKNIDTVYVTKVTEAVSSGRSAGKADRKLASFDWMYDGNRRNGLRAICLRNDGEFEVISLPGMPTCIAFGSNNSFVTATSSGMNIISDPPLEDVREEQSKSYQRRNSDTDDLTHFDPTDERKKLFDRSNSINMAEFLYEPGEILKNDICVTMRRRAEAGYSMNCRKSSSAVDDEYLKDMWDWLEEADERARTSGMSTAFYDLNYVGVSGIWTGDLGMGQESRFVKGPFRTYEYQMSQFNHTAEELRKKYQKDDFVGATSFHARRSLALVICGWKFNRSDLEQQLRELEKNEQYAKAAGWALFHNDLERCVKSLSMGGERMKLVSTAVAAYNSRRRLPDNGSNDVWKELCQSMAVELDDPYLRAIFAFVSNGEWKDVLDDVALPIRERLGIALRFLNDDDLRNYIHETTQRAVRNGEPEGILLTGISDSFIDLMQVYVNRVGDVQTAALAASFAVPRYFNDERVNHWVESYRELLNSWKLFHARARFDVSRGHKARDRNGLSTIENPQRQVFVRCNTCDRSVTTHLPIQSTVSQQKSRLGATGGKDNQKHIPPQQVVGSLITPKSTMCPVCKQPLPRCAVCLLHLGSANYKVVTKDGKSKDPLGDYDRWFNFCLSCNHGMHTGHAREWFGKHAVCPVPDCSCKCDRT